MKLALDHLPDTARLLIELIGLDATLTLITNYGGQTIWPAHTGAGFAALAEAIGEGAALKLAGHFNEPIYVPRCLKATLAVKHNQIRSEFDELTANGHSASSAVAVLARKHTRADRTIWRVLGQPDTTGRVLDTRQTELF